jgi:glycosyltransferase involved in cell wall biosynthesis
MKSTLRPAAERRPVVAIVFRYIHHYRERFYGLLREELDARGVELRLIAGQPNRLELLKDDAVTIPWARTIRNRYWTVAHHPLVWQPALGLTRGTDMVIVEQASRLLLNYALLLGREAGGPRVAFWGQGEHVLPGRASTLGEALKRSVSRRVDWWFAYNMRSVEVVRGLGIAPYRITCVQNAVDTSALTALREALPREQVDALRARLGLSSGHVGVFAGSLYGEKRLPFLLEACERARRQVPDLEVVVAGTGPEAPALEAAATTRPWLHLLGALRGPELVTALSLGRAMLLPGAVGLAALDAFALELPLVTTEAPDQGHEMAYIADGENGVVVPDWNDAGAYADAVVRVMTDDDLRDHLRRGCRETATRYTVEAMAENFAEGVVQALNDFSVRP